VARKSIYKENETQKVNVTPESLKQDYVFLKELPLVVLIILYG
jgi:hypothetical protein